MNSTRGPLTEHQRKTLEALASYWQEFRRPPTIRELAARTGRTSTSAIRYDLLRLEREGLVRQTGVFKSSRSWEIVSEAAA